MSPPPHALGPPRTWMARSLFGGALMGLANLVPGISGGTMLLAAGVYPQFIGGVAEVTSLRLRGRTIMLLACVVGAAIVAIVALARPIKELVVDHRWVMYSIFIGLTLGGVPVLWRMMRPLSPAAIGGAAAGLAAMAALALVQSGGAGAPPPGTGASIVLLLLAGAAGGSAMILPGVSGAYLLLLLGQYIVILDAVDALRAGASGGDGAQVRAALAVLLPVGVGVVLGVVGVSHGVRFLLRHVEQATLGVLLGFLLGAVLGLWPFQEAVPPAEGTLFGGERVILIEGNPVLESSGHPLEPKHWPTDLFAPSARQVAGALALIAAGFTVSGLVDRFGARAEGRRSR